MEDIWHTTLVTTQIRTIYDLHRLPDYDEYDGYGKRDYYG